MPPLIAVGVLGAVALAVWLLSRPAASDELPIDPIGGDPLSRAPIAKIEIGKRGPGAVVELPKIEAQIVTPPRPGLYYRIVEGDTGSAIALRAYAADRPTAKWLEVAAHPKNAVRLGAKWSNWFLPRWARSDSVAGAVYTGSYSGAYAVVYIPREEEL